jgi:cell division protein FtsL
MPNLVAGTPMTEAPSTAPKTGARIGLWRFGAVGLLCLAVAAGTATTLMHVRLKLEILELGYLLGREARAERELEQAAERLRVELALLKSPARIDRIARGELGLVPPEPDQIRRIDPERPWRAQPEPANVAAAPQPPAKPAAAPKPGKLAKPVAPAAKPIAAAARPVKLVAAHKKAAKAPALPRRARRVAQAEER